MNVEKILEATERIFADQTFKKSAKKQILADIPDYGLYLSQQQKIRLDKAIVDPILHPCYEAPLFKREQEFHAFRKLNYLKSLARDAALKNLPIADVYFQEMMEVKNLIALANMRLAANLAKKIKTFFRNDIYAESYMSLLKAVDYFDWRRGLKFSTYATMCIYQNLNRASKKLAKTQNYDNLPEMLSKDLGYEFEYRQKENIQLIRKFLNCLNGRDVEIVMMRYGIDRRPRTLEQIGDHFHISKERVRQILRVNLEKLQNYAKTNNLAFEPR